jgi:hypothetical protein
MSPIKKILYTVVIGLFFSSICSFLLSKGLKKYHEKLNRKYETAFIDTANYDLLFVGSSRVLNNMNPKIIDSITNLKSFNAGAYGANLYESKFIIESYLEKHPSPKSIFLGVDLFSFNTKNKLFNYTYYLPFSENKNIASVLKSLDHNTSLYKYFPFLQLGDYDDFAKTNAIKGLLSQKELNENQKEYQGFISLGKEILDTNKLNIPAETVLIDSIGINSLNEILAICKKRNIKLQMFYAPEYKAMWQKKVTNASAIFSMIDSFAIKNKLSFFRYDRTEICNNPKYFYNVRHLNNEGAAVFSEIVAKDLK